MISDIFNPFVVEMSVDAPLRDIPAGNGNEVPLDFSGLPTLAVTGASQVQVSTHPHTIILPHTQTLLNLSM